MKKIESLGVVNYHTYGYEEFKVKGDVIAFSADNGTGKTVLMTALYPSVFTFDLNRSINMGGKQERKATAYIKENTYIFIKIRNEQGEYTLVNHYYSYGKGKAAYILNTHNVVFTRGEDKTPLTLEEFKRENFKSDYTCLEFKEQKKYQEWIAKNIFGYSLERFKIYIRSQQPIANPIAPSLNSNFGLDKAIENIQKGFATIEDDDLLNNIIEPYSKASNEAYKKRVELQKSKELLETLSAKRLKTSEKNKKEISSIRRIQKKMSKELVDEENNLLELKDDIFNKKENLEKKEDELKNKQLEEEDLKKNLSTIEITLANSNIEQQIELKKQKLATLQENLSHKTKQQKQNANFAEGIGQSVQQYCSQVQKIEEDIQLLYEPVLEFELSNWDAIRKEAESYKQVLFQKEKLENEQEYTIRNIEEFQLKYERTRSELETEIKNYQRELLAYYELINATPSPNETFAEYHHRILTESIGLKQATKELISKLKEDKKGFVDELNKLKQTTEPQTTFIAKSGKPLFELIDFNNDIPVHTQEMIESTLRESGLLELIVDATDVEKGTYLCQNR
jgi:predicted chromosome segregation ATPase